MLSELFVQETNGIRKRTAGNVLDELYYVSVGTTTEAVIEALVGRHGEASRSLFMEGTARLVFSSVFPQPRYIFVDHVFDPDFRQKLFQELGTESL